jgi:glutaredoxin
MFSSGEYTNSYTNPYSEYTSLNEYYKGSQFGPRLPATVPSMSYPTLLADDQIRRYDALTHGSDGNTYFNVQNAYSKSCDPKYYVAKCPENKFVRPFVPQHHGTHPTACPVENEPIVEGFHATTEAPESLVHQLRALRVIFFYDGSGKCPHSLNAIKSYRQQLGNVPLEQVFSAIKDIRMFENERMLTDLNGTATPFFYSQQTFRSVTGFVPRLTTLVHQLSVTKESYTPPSHKDNSVIAKLSDLNLVVYVMKGCGYCDKLKDLLAKHGAKVEIVDAMDPARRHEIRHVRGFPHYKSRKTGKESTGYPGSIEKLIQSVS